jgi:hypothetical protein
MHLIHFMAQPVPDEHINDVIILDYQGATLHELPANEFQVPKKVGLLKADQFSRLKDDWICYPHVRSPL